LEDLDTSADRWISFAWLMTVPLAIVEWLLLFSILPRLVHTPAFPQAGGVFLPHVKGHPEPLEQARYVFGVCCAFALYAAAAPAYHWWANRHPPVGGWLRLVLRAAIVGIQGTILVAAIYLWRLNSQQQDKLRYFSNGYLVGAAIAAVCGLAAFLFLAPRKPVSDGRVARLLPRTLALGFAAIGLLPAIFTTSNIAHGNETLLFHTAFSLGDFGAVLSGRTPVVDYAPQYQNFLPFLAAPIFRVVGLTFTSFSLVMALLSFAELALVYAILKQLTRSDWAAMVLFIPLAAIGFHRLPDTPSPIEQVYSFNIYCQHPLRTFGPWLVAFLCARYLAQPSARKMVAVFLVGAFAAINNVDFGLPAFLTSLVVVLATADAGLLPSKKNAQAILLRASLAAAGALSVFLVICLLRSGQLPNFGRWLAVQKMFAIAGYGMRLMPDRDVYWIVFATFQAAVVVALFGLARDDSGDQGLRERYGMLLFSGLFGFGASMYYVARSHPYSLIVVFSFWAFSLGLLLWEAFVSWQPLTARRVLIGILPVALLIANFSICASDLVHTLSPLGQLERLSINDSLFADDVAEMVAFVKQHSTVGERVLVYSPYGHMIAVDAGVEGVSPAPSSEMLTFAQLDELMDAVDGNQVNRLFGKFRPEAEECMTAEGFQKVDVLKVTAVPASCQGKGSCGVFGTPFEYWERDPLWAL
jgi:hypothetical protein